MKEKTMNKIKELDLQKSFANICEASKVRFKVFEEFADYIYPSLKDLKFFDASCEQEDAYTMYLRRVCKDEEDDIENPKACELLFYPVGGLNPYIFRYATTDFSHFKKYLDFVLKCVRNDF